MKKMLALLMMLALAMTTFGSFAAAEEAPLTVAGPDDATAKFEMWSFVDAHNTFYASMVDEWNKLNPDRTIQITFTTYPYEDMHTKLLVALQDGNGAPDISDVEINRIAWFTMVDGEVPLYPMNDALAPYADSLVTSRLDIYSGMDGTTRYGVPFHVGASVMYWNADLFERYGLDYKSVKTWDDYTELGRQLKEASNGEVYLTSVDTNAIEWLWIAMVEYGEDWTGGNEGVPNVQLESVKKMLEMQQQWVNEGIAMVTPGGHLDTEEGYSIVMNEQIASFPKALWYMDRIVRYMPDLEGKYDLTEIPVFEEGQKNCVGLGGTGTVVTNQCENPELAAEWLAWAKCDELGQRYIWDILGFDVCNKTYWYDEEWVNDETNPFNTFFRTKPLLLLQQLDQADAIGKICVTRHSRTLNNYVNGYTLNYVLEDNMNVDEALQDLQDYLDLECQ